MDCGEIISQLPNFQKVLSKIKACSRHVPYSDYKHILDFIDNPEVINCLKNVPSKLIADFLIDDPHCKSYIIESYRNIGFPEQFIDEVILYSSGRPKVDMTYLLPNFKYYPIEWRSLVIPHRHDNLFWAVDIVDGIYQNNIIPVIRYQPGMSGYFTFSDEGAYCGTFYYYEPDSPYLLHSKTTLITTNKITACLDLGLSPEWIAHRLYDQTKTIKVEDGYNLVIFTPQRVGFNVSGNIFDQWLELIDQYKNRTVNSLIHYPLIYALEDTFDQIICALAHNRGIDTIILKYMTGRSRVVSEVLDVRSREESYDNIYLPDYYLDYL